MYNLTRMTYTDTGFSMWHYNAPNDTLAEVQAPDYFPRKRLTGNDLVIVTATDGFTILYVNNADDTKTEITKTLEYIKPTKV